MLLLALDQHSQVPAYRQICDRIVRLVDDGTLALGERLPPTRIMATTLGVNRSTVVRAYQELWPLGYLESRPGSYSTVRGRARAITGRRGERPCLINWGAATPPANRFLLGELRRHTASRVDGEPGRAINFGSLAADRGCIERLLAISRFSALSANVVAQAALHRFCASGCYESLLRRVHRAYRKRMLTLLAALKRHMPERGVSWTLPTGGYTLWLTIESTSCTEERVDAQLREHGVLASRGSLFHASPHPGIHFRISIANLDEAAIEEGCRRLGAALAPVVEG